jgi:hypothetical protein
MKPRSHKCGSCKWFIKLKNDEFSSGLCDAYDRRTNTSYGKKCIRYKYYPVKKLKEGE